MTAGEVLFLKDGMIKQNLTALCICNHSQTKEEFVIQKKKENDADQSQKNIGVKILRMPEKKTENINAKLDKSVAMKLGQLIENGAKRIDGGFLL